ncbi:hypothetical protein A3860_08395 [Niastella vici]|uniref:DUF4142 domain-containing protein n=1 Tax=Niastella vici TaxID=1703345 RepID=A0A1V9FH99_9BACT|nr:DUF4142 domain-containing protein [Niastella vici]OQP57641.1 hypothetical protein A3860_08395 [Niastella vici]
MKKNNVTTCLLFLFVLACTSNQNKSSVAIADSANEAKTDTTKYRDTTTTAGITMGVNDETARFLVDVADVNMTEVKLGQMAKDKASSQRVKNFGDMMVRDHTSADNELRTLAANKNVTLPTSVGTDHQNKINALSKKSGRRFDKACMDIMEDGHEETVRDFNRNKDNKNADVAAFVNKMLPTLQMHLDSAKAIKKALR